MKTREEVEALKQNWLKDPSWDIESTGGFEEYAIELAGFGVEHRAIWQEEREKQKAEAYRNTPAREATLRDMLAASALAGYRANQETYLSPPNAAAEWAYDDADAMMHRRRES